MEPARKRQFDAIDNRFRVALAGIVPNGGRGGLVTAEQLNKVAITLWENTLEMIKMSAVDSDSRPYR